MPKSKWTEEEQKNLENPDNWDAESEKVIEPVSPGRVVVSVAFKRAELELVSSFAEARHEKLSAFIRQAAIERVTRVAKITTFGISGESGITIVSAYPPSDTFITAAAELEPDEVTTG